MGKFSREELVKAFDHYREVVIATNPKGSDKRPWANLFSEDCVYFEHQRGVFNGREAIYNWISTAMGHYPAEEFIEFPIEWYVVDEEEGRIVAYIQNRMSDPGDGQLYQEGNVSIIKYAGDNLWSYQEDIYNPQRFKDLVARWAKAKEAASK